MKIEETIEVNKKIMALIRSKYPTDFPLAYNTPESRYYERLEREAADAERFLAIGARK